MVNSHLAMRRLSTTVALVSTDILFSSLAMFIFFRVLCIACCAIQFFVVLLPISLYPCHAVIDAAALYSIYYCIIDFVL